MEGLSARVQQGSEGGDLRHVLLWPLQALVRSRWVAEGKSVDLSRMILPDSNVFSPKIEDKELHLVLNFQPKCVIWFASLNFL
jgi:hypothetical protein